MSSRIQSHAVERLRQAANFQVEGLERRRLLSAAIAAFGAPETFAAGAFADAIAIADVTNDGKPDLVVANLRGNSVSVLAGNGDGTFQSQQTFATSGSYPTAVAIADMNGDGKPDLIVANNLGHSVGVLLGNGDGTFQPQQAFDTGMAPGRFRSS
jgi:hypothetical protein